MPSDTNSPGPANATAPRDIRLSSDALLVLFELTQRWDAADSVSEPADKGEQIALWTLTAALEPLVDAAFDADYDQQVLTAKRRLVGDDDAEGQRSLVPGSS
jgi:hypothetical protein